MKVIEIAPHADLVETALQLMSEETVRRLAYKQLNREMRDCMRRPNPYLNRDKHSAKVLHTAKRHMDTENALAFANAVYEASGIDTRDTKLAAGPNILTLAELMNTPAPQHHSKKSF